MCYLMTLVRGETSTNGVHTRGHSALELESCRKTIDHTAIEHNTPVITIAVEPMWPTPIRTALPHNKERPV